MHFNCICNHRIAQSGVKTHGRLLRRRGNRALTCIAVSAFLACTALSGQQAPSPASDKPQVTHKTTTQSSQPQGQNLDSARAEREKQIVEDNAKLLKLATDLKNEVDKTTLDTLSISVIRQADQIEKLAHSIREKMKVTVEAAKQGSRSDSLQPVTGGERR